MKHSGKRKAFDFKEYALLLALVLGVVITFPFIDYTRQDINISQVGELGLLFGMHIVVGFLFFNLYFATLTTRWGRIFATVGGTFILLQKFPRLYDILSAWTQSWPPALNSFLITALVLAALGAGVRVAELIIQRWQPNWHKQLFIVGLFISASIVGVNSYNFISYLAKQHQSYTYQPSSTLTDTKLMTGEERDIYYFVFDRYASQQTLQEQFNYDNSPFLNTLRAQGFTVKDDSVANYQYTAPSIASTLRMDYHRDIAKDLPGARPPSYVPYKTIFEDSPTSALLRGRGYTSYNLGNWWNVTKKQKQAINIEPYRVILFGKTYNLSDLQSNGLQRTFLNNPLQKGLNTKKTAIIRLELASPRSLYLGQMDELTKIAKQRGKEPKFVFAHLLNPHPPYVFTSSGDPVPYFPDENNAGAPRRDKYINQMEYANKTLTDLIATIKTNAAKPPIIIIQSDEGPYPIEPTPPWQKAPEETLQLKFGTLAAYDLPGATPEQASQVSSPVNIFRFVFNQYFGAKLSYLPDCSYVFNNADQPYHFYDITAKLHTADEKCQNIH